MDLVKRDLIVSRFYSDAMDIISVKGRDYEPSGIAFENLKREAEAIGLTPLQFLFTHMSKHIAALRSYVQTGHTESENIHNRLRDLANYSALFHTLILDLDGIQ